MIEKNTGRLGNNITYTSYNASHHGRTKIENYFFSLQQIGEYDLPAFIDYILGVNNQKSLFYVGHSQGTSSFFALTSEKPEYNEKVRFAVALGPAAYLGHAKSLIIRSFAIFRNQIEVSNQKLIYL